MSVIRSIGEGEWEAAARLWNAAVPHDPFSAEDFRKRDAEQRGWGFATFTLVALDGPELVGLTSVYQNPGMYHPHRFSLECAVAPARQGRGVGRALWNALHRELTQLGAQGVRTLAREDHPVAPGFLTRRGFTPGRRYFLSALDLGTFDAAPYAALEERLGARGYRVRSLAELRRAGTPDLNARLHALMNGVRGDVPRSEPATPLSRQVFEEAVIGDPGLIPEAYLV